jgi:hypothetical protein
MRKPWKIRGFLSSSLVPSGPKESENGFQRVSDDLRNSAVSGPVGGIIEMPSVDAAQAKPSDGNGVPGEVPLKERFMRSVARSLPLGWRGAACSAPFRNGFVRYERPRRRTGTERLTRPTRRWPKRNAPIAWLCVDRRLDGTPECSIGGGVRLASVPELLRSVCTSSFLGFHFTNTPSCPGRTAASLWHSL